MLVRRAAVPQAQRCDNYKRTDNYSHISFSFCNIEFKNINVSTLICTCIIFINNYSNTPARFICDSECLKLKSQIDVTSYWYIYKPLEFKENDQSVKLILDAKSEDLYNRHGLLPRISPEATRTSVPWESSSRQIAVFRDNLFLSLFLYISSFC
ncbi:hypothetical protein PUN28_002139 [Cardiocondyla obscurior]|uniref:Uncharacterized protein n=1 Tax=Cardiocondyla obscurior TaxID=286306 RepID=A0AAW2GSX3_9HYME